MSYPQIAVVAVNITKDNQDLSSLRKLDFLREAEIHFVHLVQMARYGEDSLFQDFFPIEEERNQIRDAVLSKLKEIGEKILPYGHQGKVVYQCIFGKDKKELFLDYLNEVKPDLTIVGTRKAKGIFTTSFAYFIGMHAPSDVLILRFIKNKEFRLKGKVRVVYGVKIHETVNDYVEMKDISLFKNANITLLHISPLLDFNFLKNTAFSIYPSSESRIVIEQALSSKMKEIQTYLTPKKFEGKISVECLFSSNVKVEFCKRINSLNADFIIMVPEKLRHIGSFIHYQLTHCESNLFLLKKMD